MSVHNIAITENEDLDVIDGSDVSRGAEGMEYATNVYAKNDTDITLLEDTLQDEECYYGED